MKLDVPPLINQTVFDLLVALHRNPNDETLQNVLGDALEEAGHIAQKWVLLGKCPKCGGDLYRTESDEEGWILDSIYWRCRKCGNDDVDHARCADTTHSKETRFRRALRELGYQVCESHNHYSTDGRDLQHKECVNCNRCNGSGLMRR